MLIRKSSFVTNINCQVATLLRMASTGTNIAVCQMTSTNDKSRNLETVKMLISQAVAKDAKMIFFPEACDFIGTSKDETKQLAEKLDGKTVNEYRSLARENKVWLSMGGVHEIPENTEDRTKLYNAHVVIDQDGNIASVYRKLHLFDTNIKSRNIRLRESDNVIGGKSIVPPIKTPAGNLGLSVCYDLRFPELGVLLRRQGAELLTYPSAFTHVTGEAHWEVLLRARAIETQCYVVAAAQYGQHNKKRASYGRAMVVNPWGEVVAECEAYGGHGTKNSDESVATAVLDAELLARVREEMPVLEHRRIDVYQLRGSVECPPPPRDEDSYRFADKHIPGSTVFYRTSHSLAFTNIRCVVPGHVLITTLRPAKRLGNLSQDEIADLFQTALKVQKVAEEIYGAKSSAVCVQDGKDAGQTVPHVHVHILPRKPGDFEKNDDVYEQLAKHDKEGTTTPVRDVAEMAEEARQFRKYFT